MRYSAILGTGSYVPERILSNADFEKMVDTSDQWITERTGMKERRICADNEATSDMATNAARNACEMANIDPKDLDAIIIGTTTPDHYFPATACIVQNNLGAKNAAAFDLQAACSGFIYGLSVADNFIRTSTYNKILLIGADKLSSLTNYKDRETCILFGDAAGAAIIGPSDEPGVMSTHLGSYGHLWELLTVHNGGSRSPLREHNIAENDHYIFMKGREIFKNAVTGLTDYAKKAVEHNKLSRDDVDHVIPHQANIRIIEAFAKRMEVPIEKFVVNIEKYGNTSSATIPLALDEANRSGRFKKGDNLLCAAFGGGLTVASTIIKWTLGD